MGILSSDIVFYASQYMPKDDDYPSGGVINSGVRVVFNDIKTTGIIKAFSDNIADTQNLTVVGRNANGNIVSDTISLNGATPVSGSQIFERILLASVNNFSSGLITIREGYSNSGIGYIYPKESGFLRPFYNSISEACCGNNKVLYEKIFIKNNNSSYDFLGTTITEINSGVYSNITFGLEKSQKYNEEVFDRTTAPTGVTSYGNGPSGIPNFHLGSKSYQGIWLKLDLPASTPASNDYYYLKIEGSST